MEIDVVVMLLRGESIGDTLAHTAVVLKKDVETYRCDNACEPEEKENPAPQRNPAVYIKKFDSSRDIVAEARMKHSGEIPPHEISKINSYKAPSPIAQKNIIIIAVSLSLACIIIFVTLIATASYLLKKETKSPEYQIAYSYLVNSRTFEKSGKSENDITFIRYSYNRRTDAGGNTSYVTEFGFRLGFWKNVTVICHKDGETWYVCEECTKFD